MSDDLAAALAAAAARRDVTSWEPVFVADPLPYVLDPTVIVVDELEAQLEQLAKCRAPGEGAAVEALRCDGNWVFYPWNRRLVHVLPEALHRELRSDRNRYAITLDEQQRLAGLSIAIAGLSVGRAVVTTLVHEGIGGELRLADFDALDLSNLNRITGGIADVGVAKVVLAAREVAELDPYVRVVLFPRGVEQETIADFVAGVDVVVDECDGLEIKLLLREYARAAKRPVVMATSHRGTLDVERFDLDPARLPFHGLLGDTTAAELAGLTTKQKVPYVIRILDPASLSHRAAASMIEVRESVSTWPQLASDVALGGAMVANVVRRIALGELTGSGRFYADLDELVADGAQAPLSEVPSGGASVPDAPPAFPAAAIGRPSEQEWRYILACATSAPSGGNMQPWRFAVEGETLRAWVDHARNTSLLDFEDRAAQFALGAALEGAMLGAHARGFTTMIALPGDPVWELRLERSGTPDESLAAPLWQRCSNRRTGVSSAVPELSALVSEEIDVEVVGPQGMRELGAALGRLDRVRFLSARLREDMIGELRFSAEEAHATHDGIEVASLDLDPSDRAAMDVLRLGAGMDFLASIDRGWGLGNLARDTFTGSGGALVLRAPATDHASLVLAGRALMRIWLDATRRGLAVHAWGSPFLFQHLHAGALDPWERAAVEDAAERFPVAVDPDRPILLILRISRFDPPSVRSLRRPLEDVLC